MQENNKIAGRFDRIDMEQGQAVIIDFKTSQISRQEDADRRTKESLQLVLYALAYKNIQGKLPKARGIAFFRVRAYRKRSG